MKTQNFVSDSPLKPILISRVAAEKGAGKRGEGRGIGSCATQTGFGHLCPRRKSAYILYIVTRASPFVFLRGQTKSTGVGRLMPGDGRKHVRKEEQGGRRGGGGEKSWTYMSHVVYGTIVVVIREFYASNMLGRLLLIS